MLRVTPINRFHEAADPTLLNILIDDSYSMTPMRREGIVADAINEIMIPALKLAHRKRVDVLRTALGAFSGGKIQSLTKIPGYFTLEQLARQPISNNQFGGPDLNNNTALYASLINGVSSLLVAAQIVKEQTNCRKVKAKLIVLTDGDNDTKNPTTEYDVNRYIADARKTIDLDVHLAYFKTDVGIDRNKFMRIASACGVTKCHFWADHGNSATLQRKAFREFAKIPSTI